MEERARIIELDGGERDLRPRSARRRAPSPRLLYGGLTVILVGATILVLGPLGIPQKRPGASPTPGPSAPALVAATTSPIPIWTPSSTSDPFGEPSPLPEIAPVPVAPPVLAGWPITLQSGRNGGFDIGPDGTVYLPDLPALDATGHPRADWLVLPDGTRAQPFGFGSDGSIYAGMTTPDGATQLVWVFGPDGKRRTSSPLEMANWPSYVPGPGGSVYVVLSASPEALSSPQIVILRPDGSSSSFDIPGTPRQTLVGNDGTIYLSVPPSDQNAVGNSLQAIGPGGQAAPAPAGLWSGMALSPNDTLYAWAYDLDKDSDSNVTRSRMAAFGSDGKPKAGWPVTFAGSMSAPAFGPDGTAYIVLGDSKVVALAPDGATRVGWPVTLPAGEAALSETGGWHAPDVAQAPVVDDRGAVYVAGTYGQGQAIVAAFDPRGKTVPGWPIRSDSGLADFWFGYVGGYHTLARPAFIRTPSGEARLYVALNDHISAVGQDGKVLAGWPLARPRAYLGWRAMQPTLDGGLIVVGEWIDDGSLTYSQILRLAPDGQTVR